MIRAWSDIFARKDNIYKISSRYAHMKVNFDAMSNKGLPVPNASLTPHNILGTRFVTALHKPAWKCMLGNGRAGELPPILLFLSTEKRP